MACHAAFQIGLATLPIWKLTLIFAETSAICYSSHHQHLEAPLKPYVGNYRWYNVCVRKLFGSEKYTDKSSYAYGSVICWLAKQELKLVICWVGDGIE